ncbi:MAG: NAD-binding protein [Anaerolineae bacterium]|nr:NAD-binding protein [Anaerolineae bacterium]
MRAIIIGCGRMGSGLAETLARRGFQITLVDADATAFERLGASLKVQRIVGVGFDRDVLLEAGVERADALAAVTASDDVNIVTARLARHIFHVPRVVARVYDPRKAAIYHKLGLQTVSTTAWGIQRMMELLSFSHLDVIASLGSGEVDVLELEVPALLVGRTVNDLTVPGEAHVIAITRQGRTFLPTLGTVFQAGDLVHLAASGENHRLAALLG